MSAFSPLVQRLIDELNRLPGIGPKSAQRLALHVLRAPSDDIERLSAAMREVKARVSFCRTCFNLSEGATCPICSNPGRDASTVCVVEDVKDLAALERTGEFKGRYHVLGGCISPLDGVGPEDLKVRELLERIAGEGVTEVILATSPTVEGEATAMYLSGLTKPLGIRVTRIASGLPVGGDLDYADEVTLGRALEGRREVS
ncbi:MAG TPA: recombination mediator RecR [Actinomycetota bacterium]|nr:recombination mediator RecR [Actinomycetota bacterium]